MADDNADVLVVVNQLVNLDRAAAEAYEAAAEALDDDRAVVLREFQQDNLRHVEELGRALQQLGRQLEELPEIEEDLAESSDRVGELSDPQDVLMAMHDNEELTNDLYDRCLELEGVDARLRELLERNFGDQQRHMTWIEEELRMFSVADGAEDSLPTEASLH